MLHPAPPPGGAAPAWMERVSVTLPAPSPGEVPAASISDVLSLTLQRYCEQLLSGRVAVSARDVAILMGLAREFRRDAERAGWPLRGSRSRSGAWWPSSGTVPGAGRPGRECQLGGGTAADRPGRADLLAEAAGVMLGAAEGTVDEPRACAAAELCRTAGADPALVPPWTEEGRRRAQEVFGRQAARSRLTRPAERSADRRAARNIVRRPCRLSVRRGGRWQLPGPAPRHDETKE